MKKILLVLLVLTYCFSLQAISQNRSNATIKPIDKTPVGMADYKTRGYIGGIPLDSIDAQYAHYDRLGFDYLCFQYGQKWQKRRQLQITDSVGHPLIFPWDNHAFELNFFYFNGWRLSESNAPVSNHLPLLVRKKRDD